MKVKKSVAVTIASLGLLFLGACSSGNQAASNAPSTAPSEAASPSAASTTPAKPQKHGEPTKGGQVVEVGAYHLEFVPEKEAEGTHLDFYLQKGDNHAEVPSAKVAAQVQMPDGTQKSLDLKYDAEGKHYTVLLPGTTAGNYQVAILSDISGEKVNGRFNFTK
jgi:hypothetical protein